MLAQTLPVSTYCIVLRHYGVKAGVISKRHYVMLHLPEDLLHLLAVAPGHMGGCSRNDYSYMYTFMTQHVQVDKNDDGQIDYEEFVAM